MARKKQEVQAGQRSLLSGEIEGLDKLVNKPEVLESDGLRVVRLIIPQEEVNTPGYVDTALEIAKKMAPNVKSRERPPWLQPGWQVRRRKREAGL